MLTLLSCMSPNSFPFYGGLARYLSGCLGQDVRWLAPDWRAGLEMIRTGEASLAAICGLQYVMEVDDCQTPLVPLAAPVPEGERYNGKPVYFTEVIVPADSRYRSFEDLAGARWAFNEPTSHSGFGAMAYELARRGLSLDYFAEAIESGSHLRSLELLDCGAVDAITVDSTVLQLEYGRSPGLAARVRAVAALGPSPAPPIVAHASVPGELRVRLQQAMASLHLGAEGQQLLREARFASLAAVDDAWYDEIRRMRGVGGNSGVPGRLHLDV